jgi:tetratricopeptide (TPR) repeat protein
MLELFYTARVRPLIRIVTLGLLLINTPGRAAANDAQAHLGAGLKLFAAQRYSEAAKEFQLALDADPQLSDARYHLAVSEFNERQYPEARREFEHLEPSGYKKDWVAYYLGRLDFAEGKLDSAISRFESIRRRQPLEDELYYLGSALMKKGEAKRAVTVLQAQINFNPRDFRAHYLMARACVKTGRPKEAEREFEQSERLHQYYLAGKQQLLGCREQLAAGHSDEAWSDCGSAVKTDDIDKLVATGVLFGEFHDYGHALAAFERARTLDPDSPEINYNIGFTYFQQKQYAQAREFLEVALRERPDFFEALTVDGAVLSKLGDTSSAQRVLERAHALRPTDQDVSKLLAQLNRGNHE